MVWVAVVTAACAVYAAVLSTYNLIWRRRAGKRRIKVKLTYGFVTFGPQLSEEMLFIEASNPGNRPVTVSGAGLILPNKKEGFFLKPLSDVEFPHELPEGKSCRVWTEAKDLAQQLKEEGFGGKVKLIGIYRDALGTVYKSKPLKFDMDPWIKRSP